MYMHPQKNSLTIINPWHKDLITYTPQSILILYKATNMSFITKSRDWQYLLNLYLHLLL